jgi:hypothetical protein
MPVKKPPLIKVFKLCWAPEKGTLATAPWSCFPTPVFEDRISPCWSASSGRSKNFLMTEVIDSKFFTEIFSMIWIIRKKGRRAVFRGNRSEL